MPSLTLRGSLGFRTASSTDILSESNGGNWFELAADVRVELVDEH